jgi:radical SAM protein with 4Fe4S-binding SPASM domain
LGVRQIDISIYSLRPEVHDSITLIPGSLTRSLAALRHLQRQGIKKVGMRTPIMKENLEDYPGIQALADEMGIEVRFDATMTPRLDGDRAPLQFGVTRETRKDLYRDPLLGDVKAACATPPPISVETLDEHACGAGRASVYINPQGDVTPCVQFPMVCGSLRRNTFAEIWNGQQFRRLREVRTRDLPVCSTCANSTVCSRCPGLAYTESGDYRAPSSIDCENSLARTGIPSALMQIRSAASSRALSEPGVRFAAAGVSPPLVQIAGIQ